MLATTFMGIELHNPIVVAASHLTGTIRKLKACEKAGAGAVVVKTIFEERVQAESRLLAATMKSPSSTDGDAVLDELSTNYTLDEYLTLIEEAVKSLGIPVIASIHCRTLRGWEEYAARIEDIGARAIELNLFDLGSRPDRNGAQIERSYLEIARRVRRKVKLPLAAKIGLNLSSPANMAYGFREAGMNALVLFNRYYGPDIDVEKRKLIDSPVISSESDSLHALRWIGILSGQVDLDLAAAGGVHSHRGVLKQLLVGARTVEMASAFYVGGLEQIGVILRDLEGWMKRHKYSTIADFRGILSQDRTQHSRIFESVQYLETQRNAK